MIRLQIFMHLYISTNVTKEMESKLNYNLLNIIINTILRILYISVYHTHRVNVYTF